MLGYSHQRDLDWYIELQLVISALLGEHHRCYNAWVRSGLSADHGKFKLARSCARAEVRQTKERWMMTVAEQADAGRRSCNGASVWTSIRALQRCYRGLQPVPVRSTKTACGTPCLSGEEQCEQWHQHFTAVLSIESHFELSLFDSLSP